MEKLRILDPNDFYPNKSRRLLISSVMIPSQYNAYCVCVQFARDWFLSRFKTKVFNNVHIDGKYAYADFKRFSLTDEKLKRVNPLLAIIPEIVSDHNRGFIDSAPEMPLAMRRSRMDGTFFNDNDLGIHMQLIFKTILMNFTYKMRVSTRAEQLDLLEFVKLNHRAGWTETVNMDLDIQVPKKMLMQMAADIGMEIRDGKILDNALFMTYLNSNSYIPFVYKFNKATGNSEYFLRVPNCCAHITAQIPTKDDGERQGMDSTNFIIDFSIEVEMTAPQSYSYYSQTMHEIINDPTYSTDDSQLNILKSVITKIPDTNEKKWNIYAKSDYVFDEEDVGSVAEVDFGGLLDGTELKTIIENTLKMDLNPALFMEFKLYNAGSLLEFDMDWSKLTCKTKSPIYTDTIVIATYIDMLYVNTTLINLTKDKG